MLASTKAIRCVGDSSALPKRSIGMQHVTTPLRIWMTFPIPIGNFSPDSVPTTRRRRTFSSTQPLIRIFPPHEQSDRSLYRDRYLDKFPGHVSGKFPVCGHKSQDSGVPVTNGHAVCIDTAACKGRWLTCLCVDSGSIWQANQNGETRRMHLDELPREIPT